MEMTSAEIIEHLNANGNQEMMNELKEIFQNSRLGEIRQIRHAD